MVEALDPGDGHVVWQNTGLGAPAVANTPLCGLKRPSGITGTPVIDAAAGVVYVDANVQAGTTTRHLVYGLSLIDGSVVPGWPVDVAAGVAALGMTFQADYQGQRAGLALIDGELFVGFGGNKSDCGPYHGWLVGLSVAAPAVVGAWATAGTTSGIWAQGGLTTDGESLFVATGNGKKTNIYSDQDLVFRINPNLQHSTDPHDYFYPSNFLTLDKLDLDLGSNAPLPLDVPSGDGVTTLPWLLQFGKDGKAYLLDRTNLGGMDGALLVQPVTQSEIITGPATYAQPDGIIVAISGNGINCPAPGGNIALTVVKVTAQPAPAINTLWCASLMTNGSPMITTTDGVANPIVWVVSNNGDRQLHAWTADTGQVLFNGAGTKMVGVAHFATILPAEGRLFVGGRNQVYAYDYTPNL